MPNPISFEMNLIRLTMGSDVLNVGADFFYEVVGEEGQIERKQERTVVTRAQFQAHGVLSNDAATKQKVLEYLDGLRGRLVSPQFEVQSTQGVVKVEYGPKTRRFVGTPAEQFARYVLNPFLRLVRSS